MKYITSSLHLMLCKKTHHNNECDWYVEEQQAACWELECHAFWLTKATRILELSGLEEAVFSRILERLWRVVGTLVFLKEHYPTMIDVIDMLVVEASKPTPPPPGGLLNQDQHEQTS
ncbi:MAG: hypothetical protein KKD77_22095 [Gammaproteobacteria bacterium]|nr:hypothetical protein [Gammaproteobacteria bacterium]